VFRVDTRRRGGLETGVENALDGPGEAALEARDVTRRFGPVVALDSVDLRVDDGECVALVGESGSGKSTLLKMFNRTERPDAGTVLVRGRPATEADPIELRRSLGYVQQEGGLLPHWSVLRNASLVPHLRGHDDPGARGAEALARVGLDPARFGDRWPRELSGGQRQRVALARAIAHQPSVILLDEPFGALDAITRADLQEEFADLRRRLGVTVLLVTHDLHEAFLLADRVAVLREGRIEAFAPPRRLREEPGSDYVEALLARARMGPGQLGATAEPRIEEGEGR